MAGIHFELRKIFKENSIRHTVIGSVYSTVITIGPTLVSMAAIFLLYMISGFMKIPYAQRELISSTLLYCFIFPVINTSITGAVFSRYLADKFYEEQVEDVLPSFYMGLLITVAIASIFGIPFALHLYYVGGIEFVFVITSFALFMIINMLFFTMTYLYATKDYRIVTTSFVAGLITGILLECFLQRVCNVDIIYAILFGITFGFFVATVFLMAYVKAYFAESSNNYTECLQYMWKYKGLVVANLFYFLGLYVHNFVFWTTPMRLVVAKSYYTNQPYDMATCIALFTNISTIIIFTVMAETMFHEKYQKYIETIIGSTYEEMNRRKNSMFRLLSRIISHVFAIQIILTITLYLIVVIFHPQMGLGGVTMQIYPALAVGYLAVFLMYGNIVFLYYFNDVIGAVITSILFFVVVLSTSIYATQLSTVWYGIGVLIGALCGWTFSFFRIRYMERHIESHIFCKAKIVKENRSGVHKVVVYSRDKRQGAQEKDDRHQR